MNHFSRTLRILTALLVCGSVTNAVAQAKPCNLQSPAHKIAVVELYTSEGCSSCPPADRWLIELGQEADRGASDRVIPLSLHVAYWDYIGWPDRFAKKEFSKRQRWLANLNANSTVYTPGVFVASREWREWGGAVADVRAKAGAAPALAVIRIEPSRTDDKPSWKVSASLLKSDSHEHAKLFVATTKNGVVSDVKAGENHGRKLKHDYVVDYWAGPIDASARGRFEAHVLSQNASGQSATTTQLGAPDHIVAFVQDVRSGEILQAFRVATASCSPSR
jgi:hypothetical protein